MSESSPRTVSQQRCSTRHLFRAVQHQPKRFECLGLCSLSRAMVFSLLEPVTVECCRETSCRARYCPVLSSLDIRMLHWYDFIHSLRARSMGGGAREWRVERDSCCTTVTPNILSNRLLFPVARRNLGIKLSRAAPARLPRVP